MKRASRMLTKVLIFSSVLLVSYQNCFQMQQPGASRDLASNSTPDPLADTDLPECQFVTVDTLRNTLISTLGIAAGDTAIIYPTPTSGMYLRDRRTQLGALPVGATAGVSNSQCGTLKYKVATELMINSCQQATAQSLSALFPGGLRSGGPNDYTTIFRTFLGRNPEPEEVQYLNTLVQQVSATVAQAAVCAAVSSSIEALSKNM